MENMLDRIILLPASCPNNDCRDLKFTIGKQANGLFKSCPMGMQSLGIGTPYYMYVLGLNVTEENCPPIVMERAGNDKHQFFLWQVDNHNDIDIERQYHIIVSDDPRITTCQRPSSFFIERYINSQCKIKTYVLEP